MSIAASENVLYEQLAHYLDIKYGNPKVLYYFDRAGVHNPSRFTRNMYARLNNRAWPDLLIDQPVIAPTTAAGLFLELKREGARLTKANGEYVSRHIAEQAVMLHALQDAGYVAQFACGFKEAVEMIDSYLHGYDPRGDISDQQHEIDDQRQQDWEDAQVNRELDGIF
jgi:hypothetical protein